MSTAFNPEWSNYIMVKDKSGKLGPMKKWRWGALSALTFVIFYMYIL